MLLMQCLTSYIPAAFLCKSDVAFKNKFCESLIYSNSVLFFRVFLCVCESQYYYVSKIINSEISTDS